MARARNIKPGFFKNELLAEMPPEIRLLFMGLWCIADREGRFEERPKKIKMELFPCDCAGQVFSDTEIGCLIADCCSKALGGKLPSLECSRTLL